MDLDTKPNQQEGIVKLTFKLKTKPKDGVILQLHHTIRKTNGEIRRIRFISAAFNDANERLSCSDLGGNIFILDLSHLKFWKLTDLGPCTCMHFVPEKLDTLVAGLSKDSFEVCFVDVESGSVSVKLLGHTSPVKHLSFSSNKICNLLTASENEAIIWELRNYTKYFTLNTYKGAQIQQIMFTPVSDKLVACFRNDTVQVWKQDTLESVKQIIPSELKHLKSLAFTTNGRAMAMAGLSPLVILFSLDTWKVIKTIQLERYNTAGVRQVAFLPQVFDGGSNKILAILRSDCNLLFYDLEYSNVIYNITTETSTIRRLVVSSTGKYFACILELGEVNIYNSSQVMDMASNNKGDDSTKIEDPNLCVQLKKHSIRSSDEETQVKRKTCLDSAKLRRILSQYGEYPDQYRAIIWRALLDTPRNKSAYVALVSKPVHSAYRNIEKEFTIHSAVTLKNLKRLLSCLAYWCPLFGVMKFLPAFVFPFVRVLHKDPLLLLECVASILVNYCQLWFEYAPFPPINVLAMIENILAEHDKPLLDHFCKCGVTSQVYAFKILETSFSEVLSAPEWLVLWDHILSNEPSFILFAVVAYVCIQKNALKKLTNLEQFEIFFHTQNPLDNRGFLKKCYILLNETSSDIHPKRFLRAYTPMERGSCYPQFSGYPRATVDLKVVQKEHRKFTKSMNQFNLRDLTTKSQEEEFTSRQQRQKNENDQENVSHCDTFSEEDNIEDHQGTAELIASETVGFSKLNKDGVKKQRSDETHLNKFKQKADDFLKPRLHSECYDSCRSPRGDSPVPSCNSYSHNMKEHRRSSTADERSSLKHHTNSYKEQRSQE